MPEMDSIGFAGAGLVIAFVAHRRAPPSPIPHPLTRLFLGRLQGERFQDDRFAATLHVRRKYADFEQAVGQQAANGEQRQFGGHVGSHCAGLLVEHLHGEPLPLAAVETCG